MLKINNLNAYYGDNHVIKNLSFDIEENEIVSFIGPSGGGKSTLLNCINRFICEKGGRYEGEILLNGKNTEDYSLSELRHRICTVFQDSKPFPMSIEKNLKYVLNYYGVKKKDKRVKEILEMVGLYEEVSNKLKSHAMSLSGGQMQRLCIGRALACSPDVILLDEPCASLDPANTQNIENLIVELSKKNTILMVTHNIAQAERISDKIIQVG